jgi:hypothetical protein
VSNDDCPGRELQRKGSDIESRQHFALALRVTHAVEGQ